MEIETKHLLALILLLGLGSVGLAVTLLFQRMRDVALVGLVVGAVFAEQMSVTFLGTFWYRGTARGIEFTALDLFPLCLLISTLCLPRYPRGRFFWPASFGVLLAYAAYAYGSVYFSQPHLYGVWEWAKLVRSLIVFLAAALFIRTRRELALVVVGLCLTAAIECGLALQQRFLEGVFRAHGTFDHENTLSTYLCMIAPVLIAAAMSRWSAWLRWFAAASWALAAGAELLTLSRMGVPVFACVSAGVALACTSWTLTRRKVLILALAAVAVGAFLRFSWDGLKARYVQSNIAAELTDDRGFETRGAYWRLAWMMVHDHPFGVGLNNWSYYVGKEYGPALGYRYNNYDEIKGIPTAEESARISLPPAADTLPALTLGELGYAGFAVFLLVWLRWFYCGGIFLGDRHNDDPLHRLALGLLFGTLGIFLQNATEWTYRQTPVLFSCHVLTGTLASLYWTRRLALRRAVTPVPHLSPEPELNLVATPAVRAK